MTNKICKIQGFKNGQSLFFACFEIMAKNQAGVLIKKECIMVLILKIGMCTLTF